MPTSSLRRVALRLSVVAVAAAFAALLGVIMGVHPAACVAGMVGVFGVMLLSE